MYDLIALRCYWFNISLAGLKVKGRKIVVYLKETCTSAVDALHMVRTDFRSRDFIQLDK